MTEQFALQQVFGDGATINRYEWASPGEILIVQRAGDEFLAAAALAQDQNGTVRVRDLPDKTLDFENRGTAAQEVVGSILPPHGLSQAFVLHLQAPTFESVLHGDEHALDLIRFRNEVKGSDPHGMHRHFNGAVAGHNNTEALGGDLLDGLDQIEAAAARHLDVGQDQAVLAGLEELERLTRIGRHLDVIVFPLQHPREAGPNRLLVIHNQNRTVRIVLSHACALDGSAFGKGGNSFSRPNH